MSAWDTYPSDYRAAEVRAIATATRAGECVALVGLSGSGKSNLLGFLAHRQSTPEMPYVLVDCNRLSEPSPAALFQLVCRTLGDPTLPSGDREASPEAPSPPKRSEVAEQSAEGGREAWEALDAILSKRLNASGSSLSLLLDRFDALTQPADPALWGGLRALRDAHKFQLTFVTATRRPLPTPNELSELFYAHLVWLGPLSEGDAGWNVTRYAERRGVRWDASIARQLIGASGAYPALLRAACEACADGAAPEAISLAAHPAVKRRVEEFWADNPTSEELRLSHLDVERIPLLKAGRERLGASRFDTAQLTAKENLLLIYFLAHPNSVCEKDELIRAVWPEDKVFERGVRDDSLAQIVRRLRGKIEPDPAKPLHIHTVPGRGYRFTLET
jgi:energy-coupling factor transporter ATP-binding protein EcfA2